MRTSVHVVTVAMLLGVCALAALEYVYSPSVIATGRFHAVAHKGSGSASLCERGGRRWLVLNDLRTATRPDLAVYLISNPDAFDNESVKTRRFLSLGPLKGEAPRQIYDVPPGVDLSGWHAVTIWSEKYAVNFTTAPLR